MNENLFTWVYMFYMFLALYFLFLFVLTFVQNKKSIFDYPEKKRRYSVSVIIPTYNEEASIQGTIESALNLDYDDLIEVIVVDDGSNDRTGEIVRRLGEKYSKIVLVDKKNSGKADSINQAIKIARGELIAVIDADSYPSRDSLSKMVGFFDEEGVGVVTTRVLVRNPSNFIQVLQTIEYKVIAFTRVLLGFLDAIYVTPGPLALYKKSALQKVGGFDVRNMTEDIEITWHLIFEGYKVRMSFLPSATTVCPNTFKKWWKQRLRWNIGGFQTIWKYKKAFFKKGMLGYFILPFFFFSLILGVFGLFVFSYQTSRRFLVSYLSTKYSVAANTAVLSMQEINLNPSVLTFFGVILFFLGLIFLIFSLHVVNKHTDEKEGLFSILFYSLIYIALYPIVLIVSLYQFSIGKYSWR